MEERPLLFFPTPDTASRSDLPRGGGIGKQSLSGQAMEQVGAAVSATARRF